MVAFLGFRAPWAGRPASWALAASIMLPGAALGQAGDSCGSQPPQITEAMANAKKTPPMQYCFGTVGTIPVLWLYGPLGQDSFANVNRGLQQTRRYREVWLNSPGGSVKEAFDIGLMFKQLGATAVVARHQDIVCISACTILILGAYNRTVEPGADFKIHAKSAFMRMSADSPFSDDLTWGQLTAEGAKDPRVLSLMTQKYTDRERMSSTDYVAYLARALGGRPNLALLGEIARQPLPGPYAIDAPEARNLERDWSLLTLHGIQAMQEIMTQTELRAMRLMYERMLARESELGVGAKVALRIFKANLACRIQDVCLLGSHQLESLGYHNFTPDRLVTR